MSRDIALNLALACVSQRRRREHNLIKKVGFTLIELAISLVIIGLLVGGALEGSSLIEASRIRAQIGQIEQLKIAANTFKTKYNNRLPGDIPQPDASAFGFTTASGVNYGNGNGIIANTTSDCFASFACGEGNLFFVHLAEAGLISGKFAKGYNGHDTNVSGKVSDYLPQAKLGDDKYVYVWSGGVGPCHPSSTCQGTNGINYISVDTVTRYCGYNACGTWGSNGKLPVHQAYNIDAKIDDGMPQSGAVQAFYYKAGSSGSWAGGEYSSTGLHTFNSAAGTTAANLGGATNCYDNKGIVGPQQYSMATNGGSNTTCGISFKMQ